MNTVYFFLANEIHANFFIYISIARNCIIPSFSFKKSLRRDSQDPLLRWKGALCFYHIILYFSAAVIISGYDLETQSLRDVGLSFDHDTRVLHMIIRYLASPSVYSFSHFGSSTLGSPKHRVDGICGSILGCLALLLWLHQQIASTTEYQTLGSRHRYLRYLGPSGTLGVFGLVPSVRKKISHGHKKYRSTWFGQLIVRALVVRHEVAPATVPPHIKSHIDHCRARCIIIGSGFVHELRHTPLITPSNQASMSLFSIIFDLLIIITN